MFVGTCYGELGKFNEATEYFKKALDLEKDPTTYTNLGVIYSRAKQFNKAFEAHAKAVELKPDWFVARWNKAEALFSAKRWDEAETAFEDASFLQKTAGVYRQLALVRLYINDPELALETIIEGIERNPTVGELYFIKGKILSEGFNRYLEAADAFSEAIDKADKPVHDYYYLRGSAYLTANKSEEAVEDFNMALSIKPTFSPTYENLGIAHQKLGYHHKAIEDFTKALELDPNSAMTLLKYRCIEYKRIHNYAEALKDCQSALTKTPSLDPGYSRLKNMIKELEEIIKEIRIFDDFEEGEVDDLFDFLEEKKKTTKRKE